MNMLKTVYTIIYELCRYHNFYERIFIETFSKNLLVKFLAVGVGY